MKLSHFLAAGAAILASTACNGDKGSGAGGGSAAGSGEAVVTQPVAAPANGDWSTVVTPTTAGGFLMGDPKAKVQLIEFGSMTCPACRAFDEDGVQPLIDKYVKSGQVGFEFRNYVRDPFDLAAALITRCNGAQGFFPLTRAMYKDQPNWLQRLSGISPEQQQALQNLPPQQQFGEMAKLGGFQPWAAMRGVPTAKSTACLASEQEVNRLVQMTSDANSQYSVAGTPSFVLNGKLLDPPSGGQTNWQAVESAIRQALGS
jgi:protein-disulfide isomerase